MVIKTPRNIVSRRSRPTKAPLSQDAIVSAALAILENDGLAGLSLRRLAGALDTGPASLYVYLANLDELYALMLDEALAAVEMPVDNHSSWRDRLKAYLASYLQVLCRRKGLAQLAMSTIATGSNSLRIWEVLLGLLKEAGVDDERLVWGVDMLLLYVTAVAAEETNQAADPDFGRVQSALTHATPDEFPLVSSLFRGGMFANGSESDARVQWALDRMIDGITPKQT